MTETREEKEEKARVRRRWLTLGELLAIAGVVISGLALWNSYRERTDAVAERTASETKTAAKAAALLLRGAVGKDGNVLTLTPRDETQTIQTQTIRFPDALGLDPVETSGDPRIERSWFEKALTDALEKAKANRHAPGDARLPVLIVTQFLADGEEHQDVAVYEVGYTLGHGFLAGTTVKLRGLSRAADLGDEAAGKKALEATAKGRLG